MTRFAVFAILALLATSVSGAYPSVSTSVFNSTPVTVFDTSLTADSNFVNSGSNTPVYGPGTSNETSHIWIANWSAAATSFSVIKRTLNATAVGEAASTGLTTADTTISTSVHSESGVLSTITGHGYFAFFTQNDTAADGIDQLWITIVSSTASSYKITTNTDSALTFVVQNAWLEDGYFYFIFAQYNSTAPVYQSLWAQAIAYNGTTLYTTPQKVATLTGTTAYAAGGPINSTNSSSFLVVYKDDLVVSVVSVTRSTGAAGSATTLKTDGGNITYAPAGTIGSWSTYGALVQVNDNSTGTIAYSVIAYYNGTYTNSTSYAAPSGYMTGAGTGRHFVEGYGIFWTWVDSTIANGDWEHIWTTYYANGTVNTTTTIGNFDYAASVYVDLNGTMWMGYTSVNTSNTGSPLLKGYLGKLVGQVMGANVLASVFAFLSLLIAALFAF